VKEIRDVNTHQNEGLKEWMPLYIHRVKKLTNPKNDEDNLYHLLRREDNSKIELKDGNYLYQNKPYVPSDLRKEAIDPPYLSFNQHT
jgi:hypothetical protein